MARKTPPPSLTNASGAPCASTAARKTMRNALRRLGLDLVAADAVLASCGVASTARAEELDLATFAAIGEALPR